MRRIAITGVSGYIGSRLLARLEQHPEVEAIIGIDRRPSAVQAPKLRMYQRDITAPLDGLLEKEQVDALVHLAFIVRPARNEKAARHTNVLGAHNVIREARLSGVKHVLYLSSAAAYGARRGNPALLTEDAPLRPNRRFQYSRDKAETDQMFQSFARGVPEIAVTILRAGVVLGPEGADSVGARMFRKVMLKLARRDPLLQFVHEEDLVEIVLACLEARQRGVFNVAADGPLRYTEVAKLARRRMVAVPRRILAPLMDIAWALRLQAQSASAGLDFIAHPWLVDNTALRKAIGYHYRYTCEDTVLDFAREREVEGLAKGQPQQPGRPDKAKG